MRYIKHTKRPGFLRGLGIWNLGQTVASPVPTITSIQPLTGGAGSVVAITGSGFTGATMVTFNGMVSGYSVVSDSQITATVPATNQTGNIMITTPGGTATSTDVFTATSTSDPSAVTDPSASTGPDTTTSAPVSMAIPAPAPVVVSAPTPVIAPVTTTSLVSPTSTTNNFMFMKGALALIVILLLTRRS